MKIKSKLLSSFTLMTLLSIALGLISYKAIKDLSSKVNPVIELNNAVNVHMLELRRHEKDFLTRSLNDEAYFDSGNSKYLTKFEETCKVLDSEITGLDKFSNNDDYHAKMSEMHNLVAEYEKQFLAVVEKKKERGFKNWGLIGELRKSVHKIEETLSNSTATNKNDLLITMLMNRRHEKDYLLRNDPKYKSLLSLRVDEFIGKVGESDLNLNQQAELIRLIEDYRTKFNQVVAIDDEIGRNPSDGLMGEYRATIHQLEPLIQEQDSKLKAEVHGLVEKSSLILLGIVMLIALLGLFLSLFLSSRITNPLIKMTKAGKLITAGDISVNIPKINSNDELKDMGETMGMLINAIKFHKKKS